MSTADLTAKVAASWNRANLRRAAFLLLRLTIAISILVYLAKSGQINFYSLTRLFRVWPITLAAVGFLLLDISMMSIRASLLFRSGRLSLSLGNSFQLNLVGFLFSNFLPGAAGGDIARLVYATRQNQGRRAEVATVMIVDRLVGLFSLVMLPILSAPFFFDLLRSFSVLRRLLYMDAVLTGLIGVSVALVTFSASTRSWVTRSLSGWPTINDIAVRVLDALVLQGNAPSTLFFAFLLSLLANLALIVVTALALYAVNPLSFSSRLVLVAPIGHLVNSLPLTPGGIGVGETAFNTLFKLTGITGGAEALLCLRLWNISVALLGLLVYLLGMRRIVYPRDEGSLEAGAEYIEAESTN